MAHQLHQQYYVDQHKITQAVISKANSQIKELIDRLAIAESMIPAQHWSMYKWLTTD